MREQLYRRCARAGAAPVGIAITILVIGIAQQRRCARCAILGDGTYPACGQRGRGSLLGHHRGHGAGFPERYATVQAKSQKQQATQCERRPSHEFEYGVPEDMAPLIPRQNLTCQRTILVMPTSGRWAAVFSTVLTLVVIPVIYALVKKHDVQA